MNHSLTEEEAKREKSLMFTDFILDMIKWFLILTFGVYGATYMAAKVFIEFAPQVCEMIKPSAPDYRNIDPLQLRP